MAGELSPQEIKKRLAQNSPIAHSAPSPNPDSEELSGHPPDQGATRGSTAIGAAAPPSRIKNKYLYGGDAYRKSTRALVRGA